MDHLLKQVDDIRAKLEAEYASECSKYELNEEGDAKRRIGATKALVLEEVTTKLKQAIKKG